MTGVLPRDRAGAPSLHELSHLVLHRPPLPVGAAARSSVFGGKGAGFIRELGGTLNSMTTAVSSHCKRTDAPAGRFCGQDWLDR